MTAPVILRLNGLRLTNFRCFAACAIDLHPSLTVLVAENGRGKTALLDAIGTALGPVVDALAGTRQWSGVAPGDVRQVLRPMGGMRAALPMRVDASGVLFDQSLGWSSWIGLPGSGRRSGHDLRAVRQAAATLRDGLERGAPTDFEPGNTLPLVGYYGTGRLWAHGRSPARRSRQPRIPDGRFSGYQDCLSSVSSFGDFVAWYSSMVEAASSGTAFAQPLQFHPARLLSAVRDAARTVLVPSGWQDIDWERPAEAFLPGGRWGGHLVAEHPEHGRLPVSMLSDGVRTVLALVADVAHRCVRLNPHFGEKAAERTPGVLLIDEVDMHLHPRWQQEVVPLLRRAFPALQLVVTTHSPQVLSTVDAASIRVLDGEAGAVELRTPTAQTLGVESHDVLARVMGVDPTPDVASARNLTRYRALVQQSLTDTDEAQSLWAALVDHFGEAHPVLADTRRLVRLQALRPRRAPGGGA